MNAAPQKGERKNSTDFFYAIAPIYPFLPTILATGECPLLYKR